MNPSSRHLFVLIQEQDTTSFSAWPIRKRARYRGAKFRGQGVLAIRSFPKCVNQISPSASHPTTCLEIRIQLSLSFILSPKRFNLCSRTLFDHKTKLQPVSALEGSRGFTCVEFRLQTSSWTANLFPLHSVMHESPRPSSGSCRWNLHVRHTPVLFHKKVTTSRQDRYVNRQYR